MPFTPNLNLEKPGHLADSGTWDSNVNANWDIVDQTWGGITSVPISNIPVTLSNAQQQAHTIIFTGAQTAGVDVTFTAGVGQHHIIGNMTTAQDDHRLGLTTGSGLLICAPPGEFVDVFSDGTNFYYRNLGRIGSYYFSATDYVPLWITSCTVPPYLNCDGGTFSAVTYPALAFYLQGTDLPDMQGRAFFALDQGTTRKDDFGGNTFLHGFGSQNMQSHGHSTNVSDPGHSHGVTHNAQQNNSTYFVAGQTVAATYPASAGASISVDSSTTGIGVSVNSSGSGSQGNLPPGCNGGLILIRAG